MIRDQRLPVLLDGDVVRKGMCSDLGFSDSDRRENVRRVSHLSQHLAESGTVPIVSLITPIDDHRQFVQRCVEDVIMVHVATPFDVCEERDSKGLYQLARQGEIQNFTGVHSPFEKPSHADFTVSTENQTSEQCAKHLYSFWLSQ